MAHCSLLPYSIIIPAYNEERLLPATLRSVRRAMDAVGRAGEMIVVDNGSTDGTAGAARDGGARVVFEPHRQISRARNRGAAATDAPHLVFLDADTLVSPALLRRTLAVLESGRFCGGGTSCEFPADAPASVHRLQRAIYALQVMFRWAAGSYLFCLREGWQAVGGFDEGLYAGEEIRFSARLHRWGRLRGLGMAILREPALTSPRKLRRWGTAGAVWQLVRLALHPTRLRSRGECSFWYDRPDDPGE